MSRLNFSLAIICTIAAGWIIFSYGHLQPAVKSSTLRLPAALEKSERLALKFKMWEPNPNDLSMEELKKILREQRFSRIEDLLSYLRQHKPEYMNHYAVMSKSLSLHESSPENPRVIVYGQSANFIISFNGSPSQEAYRMLEVMQFDQSKKEFVFKEIEFKEESDIQKPYIMSKTVGSDEKCLSCHSNSRPIWNAYPIWPGAYGGIDDEGPGRSVAPERGFAKIFGENYTQVAAKKWTKFQNSKEANPRYRHLPSLANSTFFKKAYERQVYNKKYDIPRPNSDLNIALAIHNYERIAKILKNALAGDDVQYALLYVYSRCWESGLPTPNPGKDLLKALGAKFQKTAFEASNNFLSGSLRQLAKDQEISWQDILENINRPKIYVEQKILANSEDELFAVLPKNAPLNLSHSDARYVLAILEAAVPKAQIETWPMQIYEGIYNFESGDEKFETFLEYLMFNRVFEPAYLSHLPTMGQNEAWESFIQKCHALDQRLLKRMKQATKN